MLLGAKSFLPILRLPLQLRSGLAAKAGMHSTSSAFRGTAQTPYKRLNFGSGASTALRAPTRGARLRLIQTPAKRLNFAKRMGDGDRRCTLGTRVTSGVSEKSQAGDDRGMPPLKKRRVAPGSEIDRGESFFWMWVMGIMVHAETGSVAKSGIFALYSP